MKKTDSNEKRGGIYIHIPFCVRKCAYCDFLSAPADEKTQAEYVKALQTEIYQTAKLLSENPYTVDTVFFWRRNAEYPRTGTCQSTGRYPAGKLSVCGKCGNYDRM